MPAAGESSRAGTAFAGWHDDASPLRAAGCADLIERSGQMATDSTSALRWRAVSGPLTLPLLFVAVIVTSLLDKVDESGSTAKQIRQAHEHLSTLRPIAALDLLAAAAAVGAIATLLGALRGRGAGWANVAAVLGALGVVGQALIGAHQLFLYALVKHDLPHAVAVSHALDHAAGPVMALLFAMPIALVLFGIGAWRAGLIPVPGLVLVLLFLVTNTVPTGGPVELIGLLVGLVAFSWIAVALLRRPAGTAAGPVPAGAGYEPRYVEKANGLSSSGT
jgi:hypothetical protein